MLNLGTPRVNRFAGIQNTTQTKRQLNHSDGSSDSNSSSPDSGCSPPNKITNQNELNNDKERTISLSRSSNDSTNTSVEDLSYKNAGYTENELANSDSAKMPNPSKADMCQAQRKYVPNKLDTAETLEHFMEN